MKVWRLTDEDGTEIASIPVAEILDPDLCAVGCHGYGIYEALNARGRVIYTGRTSNLASRLRSHSTQSAWWGFAAEIRWTPVETYAEAVALERVGITTDQGDWNIQSRRELESGSRQVAPSSMAWRLAALYAAADTQGKNADLDNYLHTARAMGWTLQSMADVLGITREAIRLRANKGTYDYDLVVPAAPRRAVREKKFWPTIPEATRQEMRALQARAVLVRGLTPIDHPNRKASERLSELIAEAKLRGVRDREIAEAVGVSTGAIIQRLKRHGYTKNSPSQPDYRPGSGLARRRSRTQRTCERHHAGTPSDIRYVNGDPKHPVCRQCERVRVAKYRANLTTRERGAA